MVIENLTKDSGSLSGGSRPDTPGSVRNNEIFANAQAMESGGNSQEDDDDLLAKIPPLDLDDDDDEEEEEDKLLPYADKHVAKHDFAGTTDIELEFRKGSVIRVLEKADNGWWQGVHQGQVGWFPESYLDPVPLKRPAVNKAAGSSTKQESATAEVEKPKNMDETMAAGNKLGEVKGQEIG